MCRVLPTFQITPYQLLPPFGNSQKAETAQLSLLKAPTALFKDSTRGIIGRVEDSLNRWCLNLNEACSVFTRVATQQLALRL